jgi:hypothetical protein
MGMCALYEGCALPALVGSTLVGSCFLTQNTGPTSTNQFTDDCNPWEPNWPVVPSIAYAIISLCLVAD